MMQKRLELNPSQTAEYRTHTATHTRVRARAHTHTHSSCETLSVFLCLLSNMINIKVVRDYINMIIFVIIFLISVSLLIKHHQELKQNVMSSKFKYSLRFKNKKKRKHIVKMY